MSKRSNNNLIKTLQISNPKLKITIGRGSGEWLWRIATASGIAKKKKREAEIIVSRVIKLNNNVYKIGLCKVQILLTNQRIGRITHHKNKKKFEQENIRVLMSHCTHFQMGVVTFFAISILRLHFVMQKKSDHHGSS